MIALTILIDGQPLKRAYVSHFDFFRVPQTKIFVTNNSGQVTLDVNGTTEIRIYAQNSVARVLDGALYNIMVSQTAKVSNGLTVNISSQRDHFRIAARCIDAYDTVFREFPPFNAPDRGDFPFGRNPDLQQRMNALPRIELSYPDKSPSTLAYVEPVSLSTNFPLMHIKDRSSDGRLFGENGQPPSLIPHELSHALHFATLPTNVRVAAEAKYIGWLTDRIASGQPPFHNTFTVTSPFVAFIEAFGMFGERYFFHKKSHPALSGAALHQKFFGANHDLDNLKGDDIEGAVFGALFVDFANSSLTGLPFVVRAFFESRALTFDDYRNFVVNNPSITPAVKNHLVSVANKRGL